MIRAGAPRLSGLAALGALLMLTPAASIAKRTVQPSSPLATRSHGRALDSGHRRGGQDTRRRGRSGHARRGSGPHSRRARVAIVGGSQISIGQAPWQVAIEAVIPEEKGVVRILCGGSILDSAHIVTAAHCVFDSKTGALIPTEDFTVRAGTADLAAAGAEEQERAVTDVRPHPYYSYAPDSGRVLPDDIAVLALQEPLSLSSATAEIPMVSAGSSPLEGAAVDLTGFGQEEPVSEELNGKLYSLGMTVGYSRECGGENDAVLLCARSLSGTPCNGDSGSALTVAGSFTTLAGVEDDYTLVSGKRCVAGAENAFANVAAPEIQDFLDGSESPPRAPRGGGAIIREAPAGDGLMSCAPGSWSGAPTFTYTFFDSTDGQAVQQGVSSTYALPATEVGHTILCQVQASNEGGTGMGRTPGLRAIQAAPIPPLPPSMTLSTPQEPSTPSSPASPSRARVSLVETHVATSSHGVATVGLSCTGTAGTCTGKLTLTVSQARKGKRAKTTIIGTADFSIPAGKTATIKLTLNANGRALLNEERGRLGATLMILTSSPSPSQTRSESVRLMQESERAHRAHRRP
jgi:hypothetical protein